MCGMSVGWSCLRFMGWSSSLLSAHGGRLPRWNSLLTLRRPLSDQASITWHFELWTNIFILQGRAGTSGTMLVYAVSLGLCLMPVNKLIYFVPLCPVLVRKRGFPSQTSVPPPWGPPLLAQGSFWKKIFTLFGALFPSLSPQVWLKKMKESALLRMALCHLTFRPINVPGVQPQRWKTPSFSCNLQLLGAKSRGNSIPDSGFSDQTWHVCLDNKICDLRRINVNPIPINMYE